MCSSDLYRRSVAKFDGPYPDSGASSASFSWVMSARIAAANDVAHERGGSPLLPLSSLPETIDKRSRNEDL